MADETVFFVPSTVWSTRMTPPQWVLDFLSAPRCSGACNWFNSTGLSQRERMALVVELSRLNVAHQTGGPFAAAVFNEASGALISVGLNRVEFSADPTNHAEVMAIRLAAARFARFNLSHI
ncbi:MAG: hypothetical protein P8176_13840, partial [Gammaproteobacteria bacterium]